MATVRDVASRAEVSVSTVSRALSNPAQVAPLTLERVRAAVLELGYELPRYRRPARTQRTGVIALVVPDLENHHFAEVVKGAQLRARHRGENVVVVDIDEDPLAERQVLRDLSAAVDGLISCSPRSEPEHVLAVADRIPVVVVHNRVEGLPAVTIDDVDGGHQAGRHLLALGHRRIAWVAGPATSDTGPRRRVGLQRAIDSVRGAELLPVGYFAGNARGGAAAADHVLASGASAAFVFNDLMAFGLIARAVSRGVSVPRDLSVVGFDGTGTGEYHTPALTSVHSDGHRLGAIAVDTLLDRLGASEPVEPVWEELAVELLVRSSTGVPRASHDHVGTLST